MKNVFTSTESLLLINKVKDEYIRLISLAAEKYDISFRDVDILSFFAVHTCFDSPIDCVHYKGYSKTYVSKSLDVLLSKGLIEMKRGSDGDQRFVHVALTKRSAPLVQEILDVRSNLDEKALSGFSDEEIDRLLEYMARISENINSQDSK